MCIENNFPFILLHTVATDTYHNLHTSIYNLRKWEREGSNLYRIILY